MSTASLGNDLVAAIDSMDPDKFAAFLSEDSSFTFGNFPAAVGKPAVRQAQLEFFASVKDLEHVIHRSWSRDDSLVLEMTVTYVRHDGTTVSLPVTDVFSIVDGLVTSTNIYMDINPLYTQPGE